MNKLVIASRNPVKAEAAVRGFQRMFPNEEIELLTLGAASAVPDQPGSSDEALRGAVNRARAVQEARPDGHLWFGIEGGIEDSPDGMQAFAWVVVLDRHRAGRARTATFFLPDRVAELVRQGYELGSADDQVFGRTNSKQKEGAIGLLTGGVIDRTALYEEAVVMALIPFRNVELFGGPRC